MRIRPGSECTSRGSSIAVIAVSRSVLRLKRSRRLEGSLPFHFCHNLTSTQGGYNGSFGGVSAELGDGDPFGARTPGGHGRGGGAVDRRWGGGRRRARPCPPPSPPRCRRGSTRSRIAKPS